mgnify:CR=1 FL=1
MKINWHVRFSKHNLLFIIRFIGALLIPVLAYMGIRYDDLTSWGVVADTIVRFFSNPFLIGLTIVNAINIIPDPTTAGVGDSKKAMRYDVPKPKESDYL